MRNLMMCLFLVGCASSSTTYLPDGRVGYALSCSGTLNSWDKCYKEAGGLCGARGYDVYDQDEETGEMINVLSTGQLLANTTKARTMLIACRDNEASY